MSSEPLVRNVSDTALWVAMYRAEESERPDAVFRDPYARRLAGERGPKIAQYMSNRGRGSWPFVARTWIGDRQIEQTLAAGADMVVNLAAGLDSRPYRMALPKDLRWIEVDLPELLNYKDSVLSDDRPVCRLERIACDLGDRAARRYLFSRLGKEAKNALVLSEGLLSYLEREQVSSLAEDLAAAPGFTHWSLDLMSPGLLKLLQREFRDKLAQSPLIFGPPEGPAFFEPQGWKPVEVQSLLSAAAKLGRLPWLLRLVAMLPESNGRQGSRPWSGVCLFEKKT